jgi:small nuclear ribonucleoprotein (snRNP)-like protein
VRHVVSEAYLADQQGLAGLSSCKLILNVLVRVRLKRPHKIYRGSLPSVETWPNCVDHRSKLIVREVVAVDSDAVTFTLKTP